MTKAFPSKPKINEDSILKPQRPQGTRCYSEIISEIAFECWKGCQSLEINANSHIRGLTMIWKHPKVITTPHTLGLFLFNWHS